MKKLIIMMGILSSCLSAFAQEEEVSIKPQGKSYTAEVNFSPFSSNPVYISYLRFRYFNSEKSAIRLGASIGYKSESPSKDVKMTSFELNLRPGYEWHMNGTNRLSPYVGVEADISLKSSRVEDTENDVELEGAWNEFGQEQAFTRFGANVIVGADFYVAKRVYLGTEIGFGFEAVNNKDIELKQGGDTIDKIEGGSSFQLGPNFNSAIRLGFVF